MLALFYLRIPLIPGLIWTTWLYGDATYIMVSELGQDTSTSTMQLPAVFALRAVTALCSLCLLISLSLDMLGGRWHRVGVGKWITAVMPALALIFGAAAAYGYLRLPDGLHEGFMRTCANLGWFGFLMMLQKCPHDGGFGFLVIAIAAFVVNRTRRFMDY